MAKLTEEAKRRAVRRAVDVVETIFPVAFCIMVLIILAGVLQALF